jgi:hypothetical protein
MKINRTKLYENFVDFKNIANIYWCIAIKNYLLKMVL